MSTTVTEHQPITVPIELINRLHLKPGTQLETSVEADGIDSPAWLAHLLGETRAEAKIIKWIDR